jgi:hypothetical protein
MRFIVRVAIGTMAILAAYDLLIAITRPDATPNIDVGTRNTVIAQRYVDNPVPAAVIVGSSVAARVSPDFLEADALGPAIYDLGMVGRGPATGIEIILRRSQMPRLVFVEMNYYQIPSDHSFIEGLFAEPQMTLRRWLPMLRSEYRPIDLAVTLTWKWLRQLTGLRPTPTVTEVATGPVAPEPEDDGPGLSSRLALMEATRDEPPSASAMAEFDAMLDEIAKMIDELRMQHVRVVLVRFPMHPLVEAMRAVEFQLERAQARFASPTYEWMPVVEASTYRTTDGVHLTRPSATRMALQLRRFADQSACCGPTP